MSRDAIQLACPSAPGSAEAEKRPPCQISAEPDRDWTYVQGALSRPHTTCSLLEARLSHGRSRAPYKDLRMATPTLPAAKRSAAPAKQKNTATSIVSILATAGGAALGAALVRGLPPTAAARLLGGAIMGLLVGILPWLLGKRKVRTDSESRALAGAPLPAPRSGCCSPARWRSGSRPSFCGGPSGGNRRAAASSSRHRRAPTMGPRG